MALTIEETKDGGITTLALRGDLDTTTASQLEAKVKDVVAAGDPKIILDATGLAYVSSLGLRVIIYTSKTMRGHGDAFAIHSVQDEVMEILRLGGFVNFIKVADDQAAALAAISG